MPYSKRRVNVVPRTFVGNAGQLLFQHQTTLKLFFLAPKLQCYMFTYTYNKLLV